MPIYDRPIAILVAKTCRLLGRSPLTCESYSYRLAAFEDWSGVPAMEASQQLAAAWLVRNDGAATDRQRHNDRCAVGFLFRSMRGIEPDNAILPSMGPPVQRLVVVAGPQEVARAIAGVADLQHRLFCQFLYGTGLRRQEGSAVRLSDLDWDGNSIIVRRGKGGSPRRTILPPGLQRLLRPVCRGRGQDELLFPHPRDPQRPIAVESVSNSLHTSRRQCGLPERVTLHRLRHCFATHLHERGVGLVELQHLLGHSSVLVTMRYIGQREERRRDIAMVGDLVAAMPVVSAGQQRIAFGRG